VFSHTPASFAPRESANIAGLDIHGKKILAKKFAEMFKEISKTANHGVISANRLPRLGAINHIQNRHKDNTQAKNERKVTLPLLNLLNERQRLLGNVGFLSVLAN